MQQNNRSGAQPGSAPPSSPAIAGLVVRALAPSHSTKRSPARKLVSVALIMASVAGSLAALAQLGTSGWPWQEATPARVATAPPTPTPSTPPATPPSRTERPVEMQIAGLGALSPELASYVARQGDAMGVAVYDLTRNRYYAYNGTTTFTLASSAKVYILCAYLDLLERQHRAPTSYERSEMAQMVEESDNDAAQWLYDRVGQAVGLSRYMKQIGIGDYVPNGFAWGWSRSSPADMVRILTLLQTDQILSADDRAFALSLLGGVELGRWGVGDTAPSGAHVYMKDGWVTGPDGRWAQNSSGIVVVGGEMYIISVYTAHLPRYDWSSIQHVCTKVGGLLTKAVG